MPPASPVVATRELGVRLREAREEVGLSGIAAAKELNISQNFLSDVEHGKRKLATEKLPEAGSLYSIRPDDMEELRALRKDAGQPAWWTSYSGLFDAEVIRYYGYEHGAESIRTHEAILIPGLLQTEAYARAIIAGDSPNIRVSDTDQRVKTRLIRRRRLTGDDPLRLTAVISEGALRQRVGGPKVLGEQLQHLINMTEDHPDTLDLHIIPFAADAHGLLGASTLHLLTFPSPRLTDLGFQETITYQSMIENSQRVHQYNLSYSVALNQAASKKESVDLVYRELKTLT